MSDDVPHLKLNWYFTTIVNYSYFFLSEFSFMNIHKSQGQQGKGEDDGDVGELFLWYG